MMAKQGKGKDLMGIKDTRTVDIGFGSGKYYILAKPLLKVGKEKKLNKSSKPSKPSINKTLYTKMKPLP